MNEKFVEPFISSINEILNSIEIINPKIGTLTSRHEPIISHGVSIIIGLIGQVRGQVIFTFNEETAKVITSLMMMGMPIEEFDEMAMSAVSELANMIAGNAITAITTLGFDVDISIPMLIIGDNMKIINNIRTTHIPVETESGFLEVCICIV